MSTIVSIKGQSMYDLCLMAYGALDYMVKFCTDNGIHDLNYVPELPTPFVYDQTLVTDQNVTAYVYATALETQTTIMPNAGQYITQSGDKYVSQGNNNYITQS